jgi:16S rRNA (guanine1207-N2)-methyltransferase
MDEHYFTADPATPFTRTTVEAEVWGRSMRLVTGAGVFAQGRLDQGTSVLFRATEPPATGTSFLDLGCGYGVVATALALARPDATVWAVDVNRRALLLTTENSVVAGVEDRLHPAEPDEVPAEVSFDEIWSNPPIRIGKDALHALLLQWLPRLRPRGRAVLVVGRNLGADSLQRWLGQQGWPATRLASAKGFRVLEVRRAD